MEDNVTVRKASIADAKFVASHLSKVDRRSLRAEAKGTLSQLIVRSIERSRPAAACFLIGRKRLAIMGVIPDRELPQIGMIGVVWCVATAEARSEHSRLFVRYGPPIVNQAMQDYGALHNVEDERNVADVRWLEHCGFRLYQRIAEFGPYKVPFLHFVRFKNQCPSLELAL